MKWVRGGINNLYIKNTVEVKKEVQTITTIHQARPTTITNNSSHGWGKHYGLWKKQ